MLVVSDATPLNILVRAGMIELLPDLFSRVLIPPAVSEELSREQTPAPVREWLATGPEWLEVRAPIRAVSAERKGHGERQAITLALEVGAELVLADDRVARRQAAAAGLRITGTLGVLEEAAGRGLVPLSSAIERVMNAGLFLSPRIIEDSLRRSAEGRKE